MESALLAGMAVDIMAGLAMPKSCNNSSINILLVLHFMLPSSGGVVTAPSTRQSLRINIGLVLFAGVMLMSESHNSYPLSGA
jgi:hypothetical protein